MPGYTSNTNKFPMRADRGFTNSNKYSEWTPEMIWFLMENLNPAVIRTLLGSHNMSNAANITPNYWTAHPNGLGQNIRLDETLNLLSFLPNENDGRRFSGSSFGSQDISSGLDSLIPNNRQFLGNIRQDMNLMPDTRSKQRVGDHELFCKFCYVKCCSIMEQKGEPLPDAVDSGPWRDHRLYDKDGLVVCPRLFATRCRSCGATGRVAHTTRFCPFTNVDRVERMDLNEYHSQFNYASMGNSFFTPVRGHHIN